MYSPNSISSQQNKLRLEEVQNSSTRCCGRLRQVSWKLSIGWSKSSTARSRTEEQRVSASIPSNKLIRSIILLAFAFDLIFYFAYVLFRVLQPNMESAPIKDAKLQPRHSPNHQQLQQEQKQFEDPELRSSMSDVEEEEEEEEVASLAIPSLPVSCDSNQRKREAAARPLSVARGLGLAQKQWNKNWVGLLWSKRFG